jgi:hypothetical protein
MQSADPYFRIVMLFDSDDTAGSFLREDGEGGFVGAVERMAREIDGLRAELERFRFERPYILGCNDGFLAAIGQAAIIAGDYAGKQSPIAAAIRALPVANVSTGGDHD